MEKTIKDILINNGTPEQIRLLESYIKSRERAYILMIALFALGWVGSMIIREQSRPAHECPAQEYVDTIVSQKDSLQCAVDSAVYFHEIKFTNSINKY